MLISLSDFLGERVSKEISLPLQCYTRTPAKHVWFCDVATEERYSGFYQKTQAQLAPQSLYKVHDAEVRGKGIITLDKKIIKENIEGASISRTESQLSTEKETQKLIAEPVLYTTRYGVRNYGHCLTDIVPRIQWFHQLFPDVKIIVHQETPKQIFEILALLGINKKSLLLLDDRHVKIKELYFVNLWNQHPLVHSPKTFELLGEISKQIAEKKSWGLKQIPKKIFINRKDTNSRQITNHNETALFLKQRGFTEVSCGKLSIEDQIRYFATAEQVVGISGAAMTNIAFCQAGVKTINLSPSSMPSLYFWDLAHHTKIDYSIAYFAAKNAAKGIYSDFSVNLDVLDNILRS